MCYLSEGGNTKLCNLWTGVPVINTYNIVLVFIHAMVQCTLFLAFDM